MIFLFIQSHHQFFSILSDIFLSQWKIHVILSYRKSCTLMHNSPTLTNLKLIIFILLNWTVIFCCSNISKFGCCKFCAPASHCISLNHHDKYICFKWWWILSSACKNAWLCTQKGSWKRKKKIEANKAYYQANISHIKSKQRIYYHANCSHIRYEQRIYYRANKTHIKNRKAVYH